MSVIEQPQIELAALYHPRSSNPKGVEKRLNRLERHPGIILTAEESSPTIEGTIEVLKKLVPNGGLVEVLAGDGTFHNVVNAIHEGNLANITLTTVTGGGANDTAKQLHSESWYRRNPSGLLVSEEKKQRPLELRASHETIKEGDKRRLLRAVSYITIAGYTAGVTDGFSTPEFYEKVAGLSPRAKIFEQAKVGWELIGKTALFKIMKEDEEPDNKLYSDLIFNNGSRMAKFTRFGGNDLFAPRYGMIETENKINLAKLVKTSGMLAIGAYPKFSYDQSQTFTIEALEADDFVIQADGEVHRFPNGTKFTLSAAKEEDALTLLTSAHLSAERYAA